MAKNNNPGRILKGTKATATLKSASGVWTLDEAMQLHRANAWPQPNLFQPISNSLRLKKNSGTLPFITKTPGRPGNLLKWTVSAWVKLGAIGTASRMELFSAGDTASATTPANMSLMINWQGYSQDWHIAFLTGGGSYQIQTNMVLRDPSAWYHVVVVYDAAQSTNTNRVQIYINGVLASWSSTAPTGGAAAYTPQNLPLNWNNAGQIQRIGSGYDGGETYFLDGNIAEFYNIDGHALPPTLFGKLDTNNTWVPVPYTGSYGTNGFYLPFTNATTSQTLGYDASVNGTATYDVDQDPYRGSVALHLTGNGPAGGQNNTFADSSSTNNSITRTGSITQGSFSPYPLNANAPYNPAINGASAYFPKSGWLSAPTAAVSSLGTGDFTFEGWVYPINFTTTTLFQRWFSFGTGLASDVTVNIDTSGNLVFRINDTTQLTSATSLTANAWSHVAFVRSSGTVKFYINGYSGNSAAVATSITTQGQNPIIIGAEPGQSQGSAGDFYGYMSNFRVIKGVAVYTANFTPTNKPFGTLTNNIIPFSEDFVSESYWQTKSNSSIISNSTIAPDGTPSASKLVESTANGQHWIGQSSGVTITSGTSYTYSVYLKSAERTSAQLYADAGSGQLQPAVFNLTTGAITNTGAGVTATALTNVGNGWYRASVTATAQANGTFYPYIGLWNSGQSYTGDGTSGIYIWGAQFEVGALTNYTPTPANFSTAPSLLLNFANAAVIDSVGANNITTVAASTITSASKYGTGALAVSANNYFTYPGATGNTSFSTRDFTVEFWWKSIGSQSNYTSIISQGFTGSPPTGTWGLKVAGSSQNLQFTYNSSLINVGQNINSGINPNDSNWHHIAVVRNYSKLYMFIDGQMVGNASISSSEAVGNTSSDIRIGYNERDGAYANGTIDDLRVTKNVARYTSDFAPPARALPEVGGKSFVTSNINSGVVKTFTLSNVNVVGAKIYHVTTAPRSANYTVEYSDDNSTWTTAFGGVMSSMDGTVGIKVGTVTSGGSGTTGTGAWGPHLYWRYVEGATVSGHHPRCSRIIFTDSTGRDFNFRVFAVDNSSDIGDYQLGTRSGVAQGPTLNTSWTAPADVTSVEVLVVAGGGGGGGKNTGGGGGAGGLIYNNAYPVTPGQTYTVTVGVAGTNAAGYQSYGGNGGNSVFGNLTAIAGGGGGYGVQGGTRAVAGRVGGSGGGGGGDDSGGPFTGGAGTAGQGFTGGQGTSPGANAGGGGGAGAVGGDSVVSTRGGNGAAGLAFGISGLPTSYAGGGGGGGNSTAGTGGTGGGGAGAAGNPPATATSGTPHTGGGGGGCGGYETGFTAGTGGSGIVIVRYTTTAVGNTSDPTTDNLTDSPTQYGHDTGAGGEVVGNYATANPLDTRSTALTYRNGNLTLVGATSNGHTRSTIGPTSGKWYWEITCLSTSPNFHHGASSGSVQNAITGADYLGAYTNEWGYWPNTSGTSIAYWRNSGSTVYTDLPRAVQNDVMMFALDIDNGKIYAGINGVWFKSGNPAAGTNALSTNIPTNGTPVFPHFMQYDSGGIALNFGQRSWAYAPPAGFNALTTKNLPRLAIGSAAATPNQYIKALTWTGTGAAQTVTAGFKPDFIWCKTRSNDSNYPILQNTVKGITYSYGSNAADAPGNYSAVSAVTSTGFTLGTSDDSNKLNDLYIGYAFRAGGNSNTFNIDDVGYASASAAGLTAGTITPTGASVSTTAGFSIIKYNGDGVSPATISHGLGIVPSMIWTKVQNASDATRVWHSGFYQGNDGDGHMARLSASTAPAYDSQRSTGGTTSTFRLVGNSPGYVNSVGHEFVAFVWAEIPGYSKFGTYTANASTNGPFVYCGFKPAWVMVKNITRDAGNWVVLDNALNTYNPTDFAFFTNTSARPAATYYQDFVSNGFKLRVGSGSVMNHTAGDTYIFAAYADKPFGNVNGTAR